MVGGGLTMGSSPGSSVASPRGRGARSSSFLSLFYLSILAFRAFTLSIALTSRSLSLSFSLLVAISRHPLSPGSWPSARVFRDQEVKFALGSKCRLRMRMGVGMLGCRVGWVGGESGSEQRHRTQNRGRNGYTKMKAEMTVIWLVLYICIFLLNNGGCLWNPHLLHKVRFDGWYFPILQIYTRSSGWHQSCSYTSKFRQVPNMDLGKSKGHRSDILLNYDVIHIYVKLS